MKLTSASSATPFFDPSLLGLLCAVVSAVGYTAANICLRTVVDYDPIWVSAVKAAPTVFIMTPWLLVHVVGGRNPFPSLKIMALLGAAGLAAQLGGNVAFQWSLGVVGLVVAAPLTLGSLIVAGAVMGRMFLREPITSRAAWATLILLLAIVLLSIDTAERNHSHGDANIVSWQRRSLGVGAACLAGASYALLGVAIRFGVQRNSSPAATVFVVALIGVIALCGLSVARQGVDPLWITPPGAFLSMLQAGLYNAAAFFALTKALQYATVFYVNAVNASQVAMAAAAGVVFFNEPLTVLTAGGVTLTMVGMFVMKNRKRS